MTHFQLLNPHIYMGVMSHYVGTTLVFGVSEYEDFGCGYVYMYYDDVELPRAYFAGERYDYPN